MHENKLLWKKEYDARKKNTFKALQPFCSVNSSNITVINQGGFTSRGRRVQRVCCERIVVCVFVLGFVFREEATRVTSRKRLCFCQNEKREKKVVFGLYLPTQHQIGVSSLTILECTFMTLLFRTILDLKINTQSFLIFIFVSRSR